MMSKALGMRCVGGLVSVLALASVTQAEVSTDVSGSVLVFPKVVYDGEDVVVSGVNPRDTIITISNTSNNMVHAHCFYVNGAPDAFGNPLWQVTDFTIWLTRQQPTHWVASQGRPVNPSDNIPSGQDGSGIDPGAIPPVPPGFQGELKCVQIDASGAPFGGNSLKGEGLIHSGDVSKYNAVAILANPDRAGDSPANELLLDNTPINDGEYNSCANELYLNHFVDGQPSIIQDLNPDACTNGACPIRTYLTLVPCSQDFENQVPSAVTVQFAIVNEFENVFSASTTVECYKTMRLADIDAPTGTCTGTGASCTTDQQCLNSSEFGYCNKNSVFAIGTLGSGAAFTRIRPVDLDGGVIGVAEEIHYNDSGVSARAAWNLQQNGNRYDATVDLPGGPVVDTITIPQSF